MERRMQASELTLGLEKTSGGRRIRSNARERRERGRLGVCRRWG
jgi:hypothetical protein